MCAARATTTNHWRRGVRRRRYGLSLPALVCAVLLAACEAEPAIGMVEALPDADAPMPIELVVTVGAAAGLVASVDGVDLPNWASVTRVLPDRTALAVAEVALSVRRADDVAAVVVRSVCTDTGFHQWREGVLVRERLQLSFQWPESEPAPRRNASGTCEYLDGVIEGWAP